MPQEFQINSQLIENKINQLLPSQGGFGAGVDISASSMVIPIIDLTEVAEGSTLRADIQSSLSFDVTTTNVTATSQTTVINTPGFFRCSIQSGSLSSGAGGVQNVNIFDGTTSKILFDFKILANISTSQLITHDVLICVGAGESIRCITGGTTQPIRFVSRQIADISGNLVNPTALQT